MCAGEGRPVPSINEHLSCQGLPRLPYISFEMFFLGGGHSPFLLRDWATRVRESKNLLMSRAFLPNRALLFSGEGVKMFFRPLGRTPKNLVSQTSKEMGKDDEDAKISRKWGEDNERLLFIWREFLRSLSSPSFFAFPQWHFCGGIGGGGGGIPSQSCLLTNWRRRRSLNHLNWLSLLFTKGFSPSPSLPRSNFAKEKNYVEEEKHSNRHLWDCRQSELVTETPRIFHPGGASPGARHAPRTNEKPKLT